MWERKFEKEGLTFDDVTLATRFSDILPRSTNLNTRLSNRLELPMPIIDFPRAIFGTNQRVHNMVQTNVNRRFNSNHWWVES